MTEEEVIAIHLGNFGPAPNGHYFSGFAGAIRDARKFTGRDMNTGKKLANSGFGDLGSWLGALGYLTLLDQIGGCFKPKDVKPENGNSITKALKYFSKLSDQEIDAIYALRCAFSHDYSLYNLGSKPSLKCHFAVTKDPRFPLVSLPKTQWDGDYKNRTEGSKTTINLEKLGDLVENVCLRLVYLVNEKNLKIVLKGGKEELLNRYSFIAYNPK
jgi:hypothetical protein